MTAKIAKNKAIIFLAANIPQDSQLALQQKNMTGIIDEIPAIKQIELLKNLAQYQYLIRPPHFQLCKIQC